MASPEGLTGRAAVLAPPKSAPTVAPQAEQSAAKDAPRRPRHLAIILDGNGRWAATKGLPRLAGHMRGVEAVRATVAGCLEHGVEFLSLFAFSSLNWRRPADEIRGMMSIFEHFLGEEAPRLAEQNVRLAGIGARERIPPSVRHALEAAERLTAAGRRMTLHIAVDYGGREDLVAAIRRLARQAEDGRLAPEDIDAGALEAHLDTASAPPVDLLIRTAGERRLSNFMIWQTAYAEFLFLDTLWPDFTRAHLDAALADFAGRKRTFGGLVDRPAP